MMRDEPPERPEPTCLECGSYEVTDESLRHAAPLCGDHDVGDRAERIGLERALEDALSDIGRAQAMVHGTTGEKRERLKRAVNSDRGRIERIRGRLDELQE